MPIKIFFSSETQNLILENTSYAASIVVVSPFQNSHFSYSLVGGADANIFASRYQLYLPSREALKAELEKIEAELEGGQ